MKNPFGSDGVVTKLGERIPGVNKGIRRLHERAGQTEALERARRVNPVGTDGALTRVGEHIPGINYGIQKLHEKAGKNEAATRAAERNPLGANGYLTKTAEYVPGLNNVVQEMHKHHGKEEALTRARERNPIGAHGYLTQVAEQVPILNDGIAALHHSAGQTVAEERAKAKSLQTMLGKEGAITRVAELIPGTNLIAAALHEASGNTEEADRALDLFSGWRKVGNSDGALAKLAELVPGTDVVAFTLHMTHGHYPQALRSIVKTRWVDLRARSIVVSLSCTSVQVIEVLNLEISDFELSPKSMSLVGGIMDIATHFLDMDKSGRRRRESRRRWKKPEMVVSHKSGNALQTGSTGKDMLQTALNEAVSDQIAAQIELVPVYAEQQVVNFNLFLQATREASPSLQPLLPTVVPPLDGLLVEAIQDAIPRVSFRHSALPGVRSVGAPPRPVAGAHGVRECAAAVSCLSFAGCLGFGLGTGSFGFIAGAVAAAAHVTRKAKEWAAPWLNTRNAQALAAASAPPAAAGGGAGPAPVAALAAPSSSSAAPPQGIDVEVHPADVEIIETLVRRYLFRKLLKDGWVSALLEVLERPLRWWASMLVLNSEALPVVIHVEVAEQVVQEAPCRLQLPAFSLAVHLEVCLTSCSAAPCLRRARATITDATVRHLVSDVQAQVRRWDLRHFDPRLNDFIEPIHADFGLSWRWPQPDHLVVDMSGVKARLHLPE